MPSWPRCGMMVLRLCCTRDMQIFRRMCLSGIRFCTWTRATILRHIWSAVGVSSHFCCWWVSVSSTAPLERVFHRLDVDGLQFVKFINGTTVFHRLLLLYPPLNEVIESDACCLRRFPKRTLWILPKDCLELAHSTTVQGQSSLPRKFVWSSVA